MFTTVGHRPFTRQRIQLAADTNGKLTAFQHEIFQPTSMIDDYVENCAQVTSMLYSCPNLRADSVSHPQEYWHSHTDARPWSHAITFRDRIVAG